MIYRTTVLRGEWAATLGTGLFIQPPGGEPYSLHQAAQLVGGLFGLPFSWLRVYQAMQQAGHLPVSTAEVIEPATPRLVGRFIIALLTDAAGCIKADGSPLPGDEPLPLSAIIEEALRHGAAGFDEIEFCPSQGWALLRLPGNQARTFVLA